MRRKGSAGDFATDYYHHNSIPHSASVLELGGWFILHVVLDTGDQSMRYGDSFSTKSLYLPTLALMINLNNIYILRSPSQSTALHA